MRYDTTRKKTPSEHQDEHLDSVQGGGLLVHIAKQLGGRKQLAYILRISPTLLNQMIAGIKDTPMERCKKMMRKLTQAGRPDFAFAIAEDICGEINAVVFSREQYEGLKRILVKE